MSSNQYFGELSKRYAEPLIQDLTLVPDQLAQNSPSLLAAGWRLWAVACLLRTSGDISRANEWFNAALNLDIKDRELLFKAELIAEGGLGLYEAGHIGESIGILESAESRWREIGALAVGESTEDGGAKAARAFCPFLLDFVAVFDGQLPVSKRRLAGPAAEWFVNLWAAEILVPRRARVASRLVRALSAAQDADNARKICDAAQGWIADVRARLGFDTREAEYQLLLASAEVEVAAGEVERSADLFGDAAALYENSTETVEDSLRLLQALANRANSFLRLGRYREAIDLYKLTEMGFVSLGAEESAQRVRHGLALAKAKVDLGTDLEDEVRRNIVESERRSAED